MSDPNAPPSPPNYIVVTDGSATVKSTRTGAYAALILCPGADGHIERLCGSAAPTTISRMEMLAPISALQWIVEREKKSWDPYRIELYSDSQFFVEGALGRNERKANLFLWAAWDEVSRGLDIRCSWVPRNTIPAQADCDTICDRIRRQLETFLASEEYTQIFHPSEPLPT